MGSGPVLVKAANWLTHLDYDLENAVWRHWLEGLAAGRTLVRYDERGCGMSDWNVDSFTFDDWVDDLELVVDAAGLDRFPLLGVSQGAAVAVAFAARHPERVQQAGPVRGLRPGPAGAGDHRGGAPARPRSTSRSPGSGGAATTRRSARCSRRSSCPTAPASSGRSSTSCSGARRRRTTRCASWRRSPASTSPTSPEVPCPTLLLHSRDDRRVPLSSARELAALIPGCQLVSLPSRNHILTDEPAWPMFLAEIDRFLAS